MTALASVNPTIKAASETFFDTLAVHIDPNALIPAWTNALPFTNLRAKVVILNKLNGTDLSQEGSNIIFRDMPDII